MDLLDLQAKIILDKSEYESGLEEAGEDAESFGSTLINKVGSKGIVAGAILGAATTATVKLGKSIVDNTASVAAYGDHIDKMSQKMGVSTDFYQEWEAILQHSGTSMDSMQGAFKTLAKAATDSSKKQKTAFETIGLSIEDVAQMGQEELFEAVISGLQGMESGTERTAVASALLGGSAKEMGALLNTSAEDTKAMKQAVHDLGGVMSEDGVKASAEFQDNLQDMTTGFSSLKNELGLAVMPVVNEFMEVVIDHMPTIQAVVTGVFEAIAFVANGVLTVIEGVITGIETIASGDAGRNIDFFMSPDALDPTAVMNYMDAQLAAAEATDQASESATTAEENISTLSDTVTSTGEEIGTAFETMANDAENGTSDMKNSADSNMGALENAFANNMTNMENQAITSWNNINATLSQPITMNVNSMLYGTGSTVKHAKAMHTPYLLKGATIFGSIGGSSLAGGEAGGSEIVIGENKLYSSISKAAGASQMVPYLTAMTSILTQMLDELKQGKSVYLDSGKLVGSTANKMDNAIGQNYRRRLSTSV